MGWLTKTCKAHGSIKVRDSKGNKALWIWDHANQKARLSTDMTKDEIADCREIKRLLDLL